MKISLDREADAGYIKISNSKIAKTVYVSDYCNIDLAEDGTIVGIELLFISRYVSGFKPWLDIASAAEYLNKSTITVRRWVKEGKVPYYKMGKEYAFSLDELEDHIKGRKQISESNFDYDAIFEKLNDFSKRLENVEEKIKGLFKL